MRNEQIIERGIMLILLVGFQVLLIASVFGL